MVKKDEAKEILKLIGMPKAQQSDLCAYTLLSLLELKEEMKWSESKNEYFRIHDIIVFIKDNYNITYAENSRETFRKQALHHFRMSALIEDNSMSTNSPNYRYRITEEALNLIRTYNSTEWKSKKVYITAFQDMKTFKKFAETLAWETEVWLEEMPDHMIHLNGDRFLAPHN